MNVTVDSLRSLAADKSIMFNARSKTVEKSKLHRSIDVRFGTAASRTRNEATMQAIRPASGTDSRYAGVTNQAREMQDEIRTDRISSQIQSIIKKLDNLPAPTKRRNLLLEYLTVHLANLSIPSVWAGRMNCNIFMPRATTGIAQV